VGIGLENLVVFLEIVFMVIRAGFEYWLKVRGKHASYLSSSVGCQRFLWNEVLELLLKWKRTKFPFHGSFSDIAANFEGFG
jgi:hypothetical protein